MGATSTRVEPSVCLDLTVELEEAGFETAWFGDHFLPWFHTGAHCPQAWVWMASALERTKSILIGSDVTVPMFKYHPAVVGQAYATMANMYPGRVVLGVGTGEAINEAPFISSWPKWDVRAKTLIEAVELLRKYWNAEQYFSFKGKYITVNGEIFCYDKPKKPIPIYWSALGPKSAILAGKHGDHLMTSGTPEFFKDTILPSFEKGAKSIGRDISKVEKCLFLETGYGDKKALIDVYRNTIAGSLVLENFNEPDPRKIEERAKRLDDEYIASRTLLSTTDECLSAIEKYREAGATQLIVCDYSPDPRDTIRFFGKELIPLLEGT